MQQPYNELTVYFDPYQWGDIYDSPSNHGFIFRRSSELVEKVCLRYITIGSSLLDVGCGTGHLSYTLSQRGFSVIGVDHDPEMIVYAERRFSTVDKKIKFLNAKAELLPFETNSFDCILAVSLMGCISTPEIVLSEFCRVLRKGGIAIITFTNSDSLLLKISFYLNQICQKGNENVKVCLYSYRSVKEYVQRAGFRIIKIMYYNFFINIRNYIFPSKRLSICLEHLGRNKLTRILARNFLIVIEKA